MLSITSFSENITHYMYDQTTPIGNTGHPFFRSKLLQKSVPPRSRHPPGADTPPAEHAGGYGQRSGGTNPTGMQSCFQIFVSMTKKCE